MSVAPSASKRGLLLLYAADGSYAVVVHSAGPGAELLPAGSVEAVGSCAPEAGPWPGQTLAPSSHARVLETGLPVAHSDTRGPAKPLPPDFQALMVQYRAKGPQLLPGPSAALPQPSSSRTPGAAPPLTLLLLPLRRGAGVYGSLLIMAPEAALAAALQSPPCEPLYDTSELVGLAGFLSGVLLAGPTALAVLQEAAEAAAQLRGARCVDQAVGALVRGVQAGLRAAWRLDLEVLPAVAFPGAGMVACFHAQTQHVPGSPSLGSLSLTPAQHASPAANHPDSHGAASSLGLCGSQPCSGPPPPPSIAQTVRWMTGVDEGSAARLSTLSCSPPLATALPERRLFPVPSSGPGGIGCKSEGPGSRPSRRPPLRHASGPVESPSTRVLASKPRPALSPQPSGTVGGVDSGVGGGAQGRTFGSLSPLPPPSLSGRAALAAASPAPVRVRAVTTSLAQTLLAQRLEAAGPAAAVAAAAAEASNAAGSGAAAAYSAPAAAPAASASAARVAALLLRRAGSGATLTKGGHAASSADSSARVLAGPAGPGAGPGAPEQGQQEARSWAAVVPSVSSFLGLSDERQPYRDALLVQRLLNKRRANSLVMVASGSMQLPTASSSTTVASDARSDYRPQSPSSTCTGIASGVFPSERDASGGLHQVIIQEDGELSMSFLPAASDLNSQTQAPKSQSQPQLQPQETLQSADGAPASPFLVPNAEALQLLSGREEGRAQARSMSNLPAPSQLPPPRTAAASLDLSGAAAACAASAAAAALPLRSKGSPLQAPPLGPPQHPGMMWLEGSGRGSCDLRRTGAPALPGGAAATGPEPPPPPAVLALYLASTEGVPRAILEQVAEETRHLLQVLHRPFCAALYGPALSAEWACLAGMILGSSPAGPTGPRTGSTGAQQGPPALSRRGSSHSMQVPSARFGPAAGPAQPGPPRPVQAQAGGSGAGGSGAASNGLLNFGASSGWPSEQSYGGSGARTAGRGTCQLASALTWGSCSEWPEEPGGVSVMIEALPAATGDTLDMLINSMRDAIDTVRHQRAPEASASSQTDMYALRLMRLIGRGGQGMVFQGELHNRVVAVKLIPTAEEPDPADPTALASPAAGAFTSESLSGAFPVAGSGEGPANPPATHVRDPHGPGPARGPPGPPLTAAQLLLRDQQRCHKRWLARDALEVAVTSSISHPNVVQVLSFYTDVMVAEHKGERGRLRLVPRGMICPDSKGLSNTAILMEYCDGGTLKHAIDSGRFSLLGAPSQEPSASVGGAPPPSHPYARLPLVCLLTSLLEVASGLRHLHDCGIAHCDLKPANVLLRSCATDARGWTCRLSDFGCARLLSDVDPGSGRPVFHSIQPVGSLAYLAPEAMSRDATLDASIDVYSFGIMMWECAMGQLPYAHVSCSQMPGLCWVQNPQRRPSAATLVQALQRMLRAALDGACAGAQHACRAAAHAAASAAANAAQ
ncbi:hypothetical protein HYH03_004417 [Edaphochlamys debaryana]|uniref:Protein kinase domain-containing protein n=1 Tax=Edaphochlamys debaryana TaxID=47281 RepID=A0A836C2B9_9CHLO|nr:hypothetical protein HYH03_004417 [Edaphochlamys debaryana]|eukprot:KAG2497680.1 hypothetical protein HYH03_004417 [Edaphochlamys debaryana]